MSEPPIDAGEDLQILSYFHFAMAAMIAMAALVPASKAPDDR